MRLSSYHRCVIALVTALALQGYVYGTTKMKPRDIAKVLGCNQNSVYRAIVMAEEQGLVVRNHDGLVRLTDNAVDAIREAFNGFDGKRREAVSAR